MNGIVFLSSITCNNTEIGSLRLAHLLEQIAKNKDGGSDCKGQDCYLVRYRVLPSSTQVHDRTTEHSQASKGKHNNEGLPKTLNVPWTNVSKADPKVETSCEKLDN